jgi:hypothetical protein
VNESFRTELRHHCRYIKVFLTRIVFCSVATLSPSPAILSDVSSLQIRRRSVESVRLLRARLCLCRSARSVRASVCPARLSRGGVSAFGRVRGDCSLVGGRGQPVAATASSPAAAAAPAQAAQEASRSGGRTATLDRQVSDVPTDRTHSARWRPPSARLTSARCPLPAHLNSKLAVATAENAPLSDDDAIV